MHSCCNATAWKHPETDAKIELIWPCSEHRGNDPLKRDLTDWWRMYPGSICCKKNYNSPAINLTHKLQLIFQKLKNEYLHELYNRLIIVRSWQYLSYAFQKTHKYVEGDKNLVINSHAWAESNAKQIHTQMWITQPIKAQSWSL